MLKNGNSDAAFWFTEFDCQGDLVIWGYRAGDSLGLFDFFAGPSSTSSCGRGTKVCEKESAGMTARSPAIAAGRWLIPIEGVRKLG